MLEFMEMRKFLSVLIDMVVIYAVSGSIVFGDEVSGEVLAVELEKKGLYGFVREVKGRGWSAPVIYSEWYAGKVEKADPEKAMKMREARMFGRKVVEVLEKIAPEVRTNDVEKVERLCDVLIDLAEWVGKAEGYGNVIICHRACDIAAVGVGYLGVEKKFSVERAQQLIRRVEGAVVRPEVVARVLNKEAGADILDTNVKSYEELERLLGKHQLISGFVVDGDDKLKQMRLRYKATLLGFKLLRIATFGLLKFIAPDTELIIPAGEKGIEYIDDYLRNPPKMDRKMYAEFFEDYETTDSREYTTLARWDKKEHGLLVIRSRDVMDRVVALKIILEMRRRYGRLEFNSESDDIPEVDERKVFIGKVKQIAPSIRDEIAHWVLMVYSDICAGKFLDIDADNVARYGGSVKVLPKEPEYARWAESGPEALPFYDKKPDDIKINVGEWTIVLQSDGRCKLIVDPYDISEMKGGMPSFVVVRLGAGDFDRFWNILRDTNLWSKVENNAAILFRYYPKGRNDLSSLVSWGRYLNDVKPLREIVSAIVGKARWEEEWEKEVRERLKTHPVDDPVVLREPPRWKRRKAR